MPQNTIITDSPQEASLDESQEIILLSPTDPNAEVIEISVYKLVYVNGACPKTYRVYKAHSMIGLLFEHITHWSNAVDKIRYAQALDAAVGLDEFMKVARMLKATTNQQAAIKEALFEDEEFDALTFDDVQDYLLATNMSVKILYGRPSKSVKYYYVVSQYLDGQIFWYGNAGCAGWTKLSDFVEQVNTSECKTIVVMADNAISLIHQAFFDK
ncbi:hypothetical protein [Nostoc sp. MG11]|uniref:hypothetical protein n=1 Tax=Nostoc sp. MG11 TaxID=2721166 RepID=UPI0018668CBF|nr:hypothetical protein [Nostoc sp. MG11]